MLSQPSIVPRRQRIKELILAIVLIAAGVVFFRIAGTLSSNQPVVYEDIVEHFKYGSIGSEPGGSLLRPIGGALPPYMVFKTLPAMCGERLPGGYASTGLIFEPGRDLPIGVSRRRRFGVEQVGFNCALCHTSTVRDSPSRAAPHRPRHAGAAARPAGGGAGSSSIARSTAGSRRRTSAVTSRRRDSACRCSSASCCGSGWSIASRSRPSSCATGWQPSLGDNLPDWGRGRVDTFNPYKAIQFNWPLRKLPQSELIGASDYPSLWNQAPREGLQLHWDGDNDSVDERNLSAALGAGVTPVTVDHASIKRIRDWIWTLPPPEYPYPVDRDLAARGAEVYRQHCVNCHAGAGFRKGTRDAGRVGFVVPIDEIGTDPHRLDSYTEAFAANQYCALPRVALPVHALPQDQRLRDASAGRDLAARRRTFTTGRCRRCAICWSRPSAARRCSIAATTCSISATSASSPPCRAEGGHQFTAFDTSRPGNSNGGHLYGTTLSDAEKSALVEYLKVF